MLSAPSLLIDSLDSSADNPKRADAEDDDDGLDGGDTVLVDPPDGTSVAVGGEADEDAPPRTMAKGSRLEDDGLEEGGAPSPANIMALSRKALTAN